jgi:hypothetical protein
MKGKSGKGGMNERVKETKIGMNESRKEGRK